MEVLIYGLIAENNFGCPSLMHGIYDLLRSIDSSVEVICYQKTPPSQLTLRDFPYPVRQIPFHSPGRLLIAAVLYRLGIKPKDTLQREFLDCIRRADCVVNMYGICFCDNLEHREPEPGLLLRLKSVIARFLPSVCARILGTKTVKTPASYGPIRQSFQGQQARWSARFIFHKMYAREAESARQMKELAKVKRDIPVYPDIANYWRISNVPLPAHSRVGISVSHQIVKQWKSATPFQESMASLIKHISKKYGAQIVLIPNECSGVGVDDVTIAEEIRKLSEIEDLQILPVKDLTATQVKEHIAGCDAVVAARYHSCVAALSSGVPLLVVGWHYKYRELLNCYNQSKWLLTEECCNTDDLIRMFDDLWEHRTQIKAEIIAQREYVLEKLERLGREIIA